MGNEIGKNNTAMVKYSLSSFEIFVNISIHAPNNKPTQKKYKTNKETQYISTFILPPNRKELLI